MNRKNETALNSERVTWFCVFIVSYLSFCSQVCLWEETEAQIILTIFYSGGIKMYCTELSWIHLKYWVFLLNTTLYCLFILVGLIFTVEGRIFVWIRVCVSCAIDNYLQLIWTMCSKRGKNMTLQYENKEAGDDSSSECFVNSTLKV